MDLAGFVLTVVPLAIKTTALITKAYDVYRSGGAYYRDDMVTLVQLEQNKFCTWIHSRRFISKGGLQRRLRTAMTTDQQLIMREYVLALKVIVKILTILEDIQILTDKRSGKAPLLATAPKRKLKFWWGSGATATAPTNHQNLSGLTVVSMLTASTTRSIEGQTVAGSARSMSTGNTSEGRQIERQLEQYLNEAYSQSPGSASKVKLKDDFNSLGALILPTNMGALDSSQGVKESPSRVQRIKDVFRSVALDTETVLEQLHNELKKWNNELSPLLGMLQGKVTNGIIVMTACTCNLDTTKVLTMTNYYI